MARRVRLPASQQKPGFHAKIAAEAMGKAVHDGQAAARRPYQATSRPHQGHRAAPIKKIIGDQE
jgi:hypothetical protein